jgi:hypothetical protein
MEMIMLRKPVLTGAMLLSTVVLLTYCNLPKKDAETSLPTPEATITQAVTIFDTPTVEFTPTARPTQCENLYQPSQVGDTWVYQGSNTALTSYERTDTITNSYETSFTSRNTLSGVTFNVEYTCSPEGLIANDPVQQYLGPLLNSPGSQISVELKSVSGVSLPKDIQPGDEWQQVAEVAANINGTKMDGWLIFDYKAVGIESVTVPSGTYDAMRVSATIKIEVTPLRITAGSYEATSWLAPKVGIVKTQGTSHVPSIDFNDSTELVSFSSSP